MAELVVLSFDDTYGAQAAMNGVRALTEHQYAWIDDVAVVERHRSGRVSTHTTHGSVAEGAFWGGLAGMFVGLLFPPLGFLALWGVGMGTGALVEELTKEIGLDRAMLAEIKTQLARGTSALILIGATGDNDEMEQAFAAYHPTKVIRHELPDDAVTNLRDRLARTQADAERAGGDAD